MFPAFGISLCVCVIIIYVRCVLCVLSNYPTHAFQKMLNQVAQVVQNPIEKTIMWWLNIFLKLTTNYRFLNKLARRPLPRTPLPLGCFDNRPLRCLNNRPEHDHRLEHYNSWNSSRKILANSMTLPIEICTGNCSYLPEVVIYLCWSFCTSNFTEIGR